MTIRVGIVAAFTTVLLLAAGCAHKSAVGRHETNHRAMQSPWKRLVDEAFAHARIEDRYSCATARAAIEHVRSSDAVHATLHDYMLDVCWAELHPAPPTQRVT